MEQMRIPGSILVICYLSSSLYQNQEISNIGQLHALSKAVSPNWLVTSVLTFDTSHKYWTIGKLPFEHASSNYII